MNKVKNTTIQNKTKQERLNSEHIVPKHCINNQDEVLSFLNSLSGYDATKEEIIYSIGCDIVKNNKNESLQKFLSEYKYQKIKINGIPNGEVDLLGVVYQYLNTKSENLVRGSFYTGYEIAKDFVNDLDFNNDQTILDPSCGSGSFLFNSNALPHQIFGVDNDPIAVMIAKFNYFIKFRDADYPNIYCDDFFNWYNNNRSKKFDYLIGNPPYGANLDLFYIDTSVITSKESFSYFIVYSLKMTKENGIMRFLLPESLLNVKKHYDIRDYLLNNVNLNRIKKYKSKFDGVMSDLFLVEVKLDKNGPSIVFEFDDEVSVITKDIFRNLKNNIYVFYKQKDVEILKKVRDKKKYTLENSIFGLGVVTGNNKEKLINHQIKGSEPIYTGKEVNKYFLSPPNKYIIFERENLQQVAPDYLYRSESKLVYKTINKKLKFAIDLTGSLTTNSANIMIPKIDELDIYTVLGLLNSEIYSFLNIKLFGGVNKVSKENLQHLPLPNLSKQQNLHIKEMVLNIISGNSEDNIEEYINHEVFGFNDEEIQYISDVVSK